ncbi:hypothetical protein HPB47_012375 [Ixodes persulcatus]|uniref:Uncharacterized protein n=1 Tax=Ixodes persulcatus TaxID=34615 RepID=A0AC60NTT3_IXOPE|nr:hypothetical protein HPB47_012375 [Ixodes persulcatus]
MLEPPRRVRLAPAIATAGDSEGGRWDPVLGYSSPGLRHAPRRRFSEPRRDCCRTPEPNDKAFGYTRWAVDAPSGETLLGPFLRLCAAILRPGSRGSHQPAIMADIISLLSYVWILGPLGRWCIWYPLSFISDSGFGSGLSAVLPVRWDVSLVRPGSVVGAIPNGIAAARDPICVRLCPRIRPSPLFEAAICSALNCAAGSIGGGRHPWRPSPGPEERPLSFCGPLKGYRGLNRRGPLLDLPTTTPCGGPESASRLVPPASSPHSDVFAWYGDVDVGQMPRGALTDSQGFDGSPEDVCRRQRAQPEEPAPGAATGLCATRRGGRGL